jgi:hypothetical protein
MRGNINVDNHIPYIYMIQSLIMRVVVFWTYLPSKVRCGRVDSADVRRQSPQRADFTTTGETRPNLPVNVVVDWWT